MTQSLNFTTLQPPKEQCLICDEKTAVKTPWINRKTGEKWKSYFDLCENCKLIKNCFTCLYSKAWFLRYRGKCDVGFKLLIIYTNLDIESETKTEETKNYFNKIISKYSLENLIHRDMRIQVFFNILREKIQEEVMKDIPQCSIYKTKRIGNTIRDFWNHIPCKRYRRGDATKEEFWDYNND